MNRRALVAYTIVAAAAFAAALSGLWDPDLFHHLSVGRAILRGTSFATEPFVFPMAGAPSGWPPYWLGSVLIYLSSLALGLAGPVLLVGLAGAVLFAVLLLDATDGERDALRLAVGMGVLALVLPMFRGRSAPRPEVFATLFIAYTLLALRRSERGRPRLLLFFPLVAIAWTQIHVSAVMGLGLVGLGLAWGAVRIAWRCARGAAPAPAWRELAPAAIALAGGGVVVAFSPSGRAALFTARQFLLSMVGVGGARSDSGVGAVVDVMRHYVAELQPPTLAQWLHEPFGWLVALALVSLALHRSAGWGRELASVLAFAAFASTATRFAALAAYVAAPIAARNLSSWLEGVRARRPRLATAGGALLLAGGIAAAVPPTLALPWPLGVGYASDTFPRRAAEYLNAIDFDGRLYNEFGFGGYLEWALDRPVFQDGRGFGRAEDLRDALPEPVSPARMARLDARYRFDALVIDTDAPIDVTPAFLERMATGVDELADRRVWSLVAFDGAAALYLRREGRWAAQAARDEYRVLAPGAPLPRRRLTDAAFAAALRSELERAVSEAPACVRCRVNLARMLVEAGQPEAVEAVVAPVRGATPQLRAQVETVLGSAAERRRDLGAAEAHYRAAIPLAAEPAPLRRAAARLAIARGDARGADRLLAANLRDERDPADLSLAAGAARTRGDVARAQAFELEAQSATMKQRARTLFEDAFAATQAGRSRDAIALYQQALAFDAGLAIAHTNLGYLYLDAGAPDAAFVELSRAVGVDPGQAEAWYGLGLVGERRGDPRGAADGFRRYLALQPRGHWSMKAEERLAALERAGGTGR